MSSSKERSFPASPLSLARAHSLAYTTTTTITTHPSPIDRLDINYYVVRHSIFLRMYYATTFKKSEKRLGMIIIMKLHVGIMMIPEMLSPNAE